MIHFVMLTVACLVAWLYRIQWHPLQGSWRQRWYSGLTALILPCALVLATALSIVWMGPQGQMAGSCLGDLSYGCSLGILLFASGWCLVLTGKGWRSLHWIRQCPTTVIPNHTASRLMPTTALFAAQVGFWQPELVVSQGLVERLDPSHLAAVLAHERAHYHFRDTYWFFWLGWLRTCSAWLPNSQSLWETLVMLREVRADSWAAAQVDPLVLAESLLMVTQDRANWHFGLECAAHIVPADDALREDPSHLALRIDALLTDPVCDYQGWTWVWIQWCLALLPLVIVPFHG